MPQARNHNTRYALITGGFVPNMHHVRDLVPNT